MLAHASVLDGQGYARRVVDSALALRRALPGSAVTLATVESPRALRRREPREEVARSLAPAGIALEILHALPRRAGLKAFSDRAAALAIRRLCARKGIDAVHAHGPRAGRTALRAAEGKMPVVADVHGDRAAEARLEKGVADGPETPPDPVEAAVVFEASGAVYASEALADRFPASAGRPRVVVPCLVADASIPSDEFAEARRLERRKAIGGFPMNDSTRARIDGLVKGNEVLLFMKGNRQRPQCGFSATVVQILDSLLPEYRTVDVLADPEIREGIKEYSSWPTIPQLYLGGEFQGGCDILVEMYESGELQEKLRALA